MILTNFLFQHKYEKEEKSVQAVAPKLTIYSKAFMQENWKKKWKYKILVI